MSQAMRYERARIEVHDEAEDRQENDELVAQRSTAETERIKVRAGNTCLTFGSSVDQFH